VVVLGRAVKAWTLTWARRAVGIALTTALWFWRHLVWRVSDTITVVMFAIVAEGQRRPNACRGCRGDVQLDVFVLPRLVCEKKQKEEAALLDEMVVGVRAFQSMQGPAGTGCDRFAWWYIASFHSRIHVKA
jgi:hypothetical protein